MNLMRACSSSSHFVLETSLVFSIGLLRGPLLSGITRKVQKLTLLSGSRYFLGEGGEGGEGGATFRTLR